MWSRDNGSNRSLVIELEREEVLNKIKEALVSFDIDGVRELCKVALSKGIPAYMIVTEGMAKGMDLVGKKYEEGEFFLSELIVAGETMKEGMKVLEPHLRDEEAAARGTVMVGTVLGDLHDIGKNIFATLLKASGFEVIDLGFDVSPQKFVEEVQRSRPNILGMSALLTTTMVNMEATIKELKQRGLRDAIKVIIGGAPIDQAYARKIGADAAARDAVEGVSICKKWTQGN
jgi:trimethylamine corrinoid protein